MTNVGEVLNWLNGRIYAVNDAVGMDLWRLFENLPHDLDLPSAQYYLSKEFKSNDTGMDQRFEIHTFEAEPYDDDEGYWDSSGYDEDDYYCCEDCG